MDESDPATTGECNDDTTFHVKTSLRDYENEGMTGMPLDSGLESHLTFETKERADKCALAYWLNYEHIYDDVEEHEFVEADVFERTNGDVINHGRMMG